MILPSETYGRLSGISTNPLIKYIFFSQSFSVCRYPTLQDDGIRDGNSQKRDTVST